MTQQIIILMDDKGHVKIDGPLANKILCYGMLEVAKDLIRDYKPSPIIKPQMVIDNDKIKNNGS